MVSECGGGSQSGSVEEDREVLIAFYDSVLVRSTNILDFPKQAFLRNWKSDKPLDEWQGVYTDAAGRVIEINLSGKRLRGEIPPELGRLPTLRWLDLSYTDVKGQIPAELGRLFSLEQLNLSRNDLTGEYRHNWAI